MNNQESFEHASDSIQDSNRTSALFATLVLQYANMAMIFLGRVPHPETGQVAKDLEAAQHFIDQLEMLQSKTRGNLDKQEEGLLKQSLMTLRMAFVEASSAPETSTPAPQNAPDQQAETAATDDSKKKFSKKY